MARLPALFAALLALAACDSGPEGPDDPILGTWAVATANTQTLAVTSQDQDAVDLTLPMAGAWTLSGGATGEVDRLLEYRTGPEAVGLSLGNFDFDAPPHPMPRQAVWVTIDAGAAAVTFENTDAGGSATYYYDYEAGARVVRDGARFTVDTELAVSSGPDAPVRIRGTVTLGHRTLVAGVEGVVAEDLFDYTGGSQDIYAFSRDGTYRSTNALGATWTGTWVRTGDQLVLTRDGDRSQDVYEVRLEGGRLFLTFEQPMAPCPSECLTRAESTYRLAAGSLRSIRSMTTTELRRVAG